MSDDNEPTTIPREHLVTATGGSLWSRAKEIFNNTFPYAGPAGGSDIGPAIPAAKDAALLVPQGRARNDLINTLANPTSNNQQVDRAFDKYHNGPGQKLLKHVGE